MTSLLVIGDDKNVIALYHYLGQHFPNEWKVDMLVSDRYYIDEIGTRIFEGPEDVVVIFDRGILFHVARCGPHAKPIIGIDDYRTPDSEIRLRKGGICIPNDYSLDGILQTVKQLLHEPRPALSQEELRIKELSMHSSITTNGDAA